ncbi:MAG: hypothetical protein KAT17_00075 [Candidatus Aminicenantes bacterium]|nr:hypothetical protein [Candidatus Aminicenantes bacterium]
MKRSKTIFMFLTIFTMVLLFGYKSETTPPMPKDRTIIMLADFEAASKTLLYVDEEGDDAKKKYVNKRDKITWVCLDVNDNYKRLRFEIQFKKNNVAKSPVIDCNTNSSPCDPKDVITDPIGSCANKKIKLWITPIAADGIYPYRVKAFKKGYNPIEIDPEVEIPKPK